MLGGNKFNLIDFSRRDQGVPPPNEKEIHLQDGKHYFSVRVEYGFNNIFNDVPTAQGSTLQFEPEAAKAFIKAL